MKQKIIKLLEYPQTLLREILNTESCPHDLLYNKGEQICQDCYDGIECEWLFKNDTKVELDKKTSEQLLHDLEFAILIIQAQITRMEHDGLHCECEACSWLQTAHMLHEELRLPSLKLKSINFSSLGNLSFTTRYIS